MKYLGLVLQDKEITDDFIGVYARMLSDIPDDVLRPAVLECIKTCRFFPTIAEIREKAEPIIAEYNLHRKKLLEDNALAKCADLVYWDKDFNIPACPLESQNQCEFANTGICKKWDYEIMDDARRKYHEAAQDDEKR